MNFQISEAGTRLQQRSRRLAADFATRAATYDQEASHPLENYAALRREGFYSLNVPTEMGGEGVGLLDYSLAAEELAQGCPATALSFNMHLSIIGPLFESPIVPPDTKQRLADLVVKEQRLIAGNFSEPRTSGLLATYQPATRAGRWRADIRSRAERRLLPCWRRPTSVRCWRIPRRSISRGPLSC